MRVLICGGRKWTEYEESRQFVLDTIEGMEDVVLITGCAEGADQIAIKLYKENPDAYKGIRRFPITFEHWKKYGKAAGMIRNMKMLTIGKPDLVIAFPGHNGTNNMKKIARKAGVRVVEYEQKDYP